MPLPITNFWQMGDGNPAHILGKSQGAPAAYIASQAPMPVADLTTQLIQVTNAGATTIQLPLATDLEALLGSAPLNFSFDFNVVNLGAGIPTLTTNIGWTLLGTMAVPVGLAYQYRARKTATNAWTLYQVA
jgi:hypothetical protein